MSATSSLSMNLLCLTTLVSLVLTVGVFGGMPWAIIGGLALLAMAAVDRRPTIFVVAMASAGVWLALSLWTKNRELFFPYTILLVALGGLTWRSGGRVRASHGLAVVLGLVFLTIRWQQRATFKVLAVELAVMIAIYAVMVCAARQVSLTLPTRWGIAVAASLLAYTSLAI